MSRRPRRPAALCGRMFLGRQAIDAGLLTPDDLRSNAWRRLFQGVYVDATVEVTHDLRCAAAAEYLLPDSGVIAGRSAATIYGVGLAGARDPVEALVHRAAVFSRHRDLVVHRGLLAGDERRVVSGLPVTSPVRTCWDLARWLPPIEAAVLIDRMLGAVQVTPAELVSYRDHRRETRPRTPGVRRFAWLVSLVDGRVESPPETRLRLRLVLAGLPIPEVQFKVVRADGSFVARVDLAWPDLRIAVEYDGLWHVGSADQMHRDRRRLNALMAEGWIVLHVTSLRLANDFEGIVTELRAAIRRR